MEEVYIVSACRTAIGSFGGALKDISAVKLGEIVIRGALGRANVPAGDVDEVILGNVLQSGLGQNPARQAAVGAELPVETPAMTINKVCGSGLKAVNLGALSIKAGDGRVCDCRRHGKYVARTLRYAGLPERRTHGGR